MFLVSVLGASTITIGPIEGGGEATASATKLFSGWLSDRRGTQKVLPVFGYRLGAVFTAVGLAGMLVRFGLPRQRSHPS